MPGKKAIFTDIDGALLKGYITINFVNYLYAKGMFPQFSYDKQKELMLEFKKGKMTFVDWLEKWGEIWGNGIKGQNKSDIESAANLFFPSFTPNIYRSSKELISLFHKKGYIVVGVSVGVIETASLVKQYLGLDAVFASITEVKNGVYTNKVLTNLQTREGKQSTIKQFCAQNKINLSDCIGIGDSEHDEQIFEIVGKSIALNPNSNLLGIAGKKGYLVATQSNVLDKVSGLL